MSEPRPLPTWLPTVGVAIALAGLVTISFLQRWAMLTESPFPVGVDGYFYPVQLRSLLETGALEYPAAPLAFWLMAPLAALTDPVTGAKLGAALFGALVAVPAYGVGARLGRGRGSGLVASALATTSAGSAFLTIEFVKNGIGLTVLLAALWLLLRALEKPVVSRIVLAVLGALLAVLAHKMAAALLVVFAVPAILAAAVGHGMLRGRRLLYVLALVIGTTLLLVLGMAFPKRLPSPGDVQLELFADAHWLAPALVTKNATLSFGHEALIGAVLGIVGAVVLANRRRIRRMPVPAAIKGALARQSYPGETVVAWTVIVLAIAIAWPRLDVTDAQGLGFRVRLAAFVPMALAAAIVAGHLLARVKHRDFVLAIVALALASRTPGRRDEGRIQAHPAMVAAIMALDGIVPAGDTIIVPERHIVFMVAWYVRAPVRIRPEAVAPAHRWRLMPLAWIGLGSPLDKALTAARTGPQPPLGLHPRHPNGLVLVRDSTYQRVLETLPAEVRAHWSRWRTI
ncbi:MAG: glycosyltransferase family 39 protein [Myxococcota bacterium]|nr:glycosyltransferase family 39 protein [Myxococcota bacterium]